MNAAQRRKSKREFTYSIKLLPGHGLRYFEHDDEVDDARKWCNKNVKYYMVKSYWDHAVFKFVTEKDAVLFALKWL